MESENDLLIEDCETKTKSIFRILLAAGVASICFFSACFVYGMFYLVMSIIKYL